MVTKQQSKTAVCVTFRSRSKLHSSDSSGEVCVKSFYLLPLALWSVQTQGSDITFKAFKNVAILYIWYMHFP